MLKSGLTSDIKLQLTLTTLHKTNKQVVMHAYLWRYDIAAREELGFSAYLVVRGTISHRNGPDIPESGRRRYPAAHPFRITNG